MKTTEVKKILLITYYWPPAGGPGVQRWYKLTKYLIKQGYKVDVITVDPTKANYPIKDSSLQEKWADNEALNVYKTNNFDIFNLLKPFSKKAEYPISGFANSGNKKLGFMSKLIRIVRSRFFLPDPRKFWNKYALKKAIELINKNTYTTVITTSPPHSTQLIGKKLKEKFKDINWTADFRDPWTDIYYYDSFMHSNRSAKKDLSLEESVINSCDKMLVVGNHMKLLFKDKHNQEIANKIYEIPNGYDQEDIKSSQKPDPSFFNIVYTGTLAANYPLDGLILSLTKLKALYQTKLKITFVGRVDNSSKERLTNELKENINFIGFVSHQEAINYMHSANLLLLIIPNHEHNKIHLSGKIFEYMASLRPILSIGPIDGDAAIVLEETKSGNTYNYDDNIGILSYIHELIESWEKDKSNYKQIDSNPKDYSREVIASKLIKILENE